jgi:capsule polysaccharide export protein KpsE/RkpR
MATILDIAGKPLPPRNKAKQRLKAQDIRDLLKIFAVMMLIVAGYFLFAPARDAAQEIRVAATQEAQG